MNKSRLSYRWMSVAAAGLLAVALGGCSGGGGGGGGDTTAPPLSGGGAPPPGARPPRRASVASYPNVAFSLAKLVPGQSVAGAGTGPSKWVSYIVNNVPAKNATTGVVATSVPSRPGTDNTGTLTDNKNGTYTY